MCGGHNHVDHNNHRVAEPIYRPVAPVPKATPCPQCGYPTQEDFVFCPRCGTQLLTACPECHRAVKTNWVRCAYCGADLTEIVPGERKEV